MNSNILESITSLITHSLEGEPPPPAILQTIAGRLAELEAVSIDPSGDGISNWLSKLRSIAIDKSLQETLIVRVVQIHFPRLAETLTLLGVIGFGWDGNQPASFSINWDKFNNLLSQPGQNALTLLLTRVENLQDLKALQVLVLMLIAAPKDLLAQEYRRQGFLGLPLGSVPGFSSDELLGLIQKLVHSPLRMALPFDVPLTLEQFKTIALAGGDGTIGSLTLDAPLAIFNKLEGLALELHFLHVEQVKPKSQDLGNG